MDARSGADWRHANHRHLSSVIARLRETVAVWAEPPLRGDKPRVDLGDALRDADAGMPAPSAIARLVEKFGLSPFERDLLLLCAGVELDPALARVCEALDGRQPSFGLAFRILREPHWSALTPAGTLRRARLVTLGEAPALSARPLAAAEVVLHFLNGLPQLDPELDRLMRPSGEPGEIAADRADDCWPPADGAASWPVALVPGEPEAARRTAHALAAARGLRLCTLPAVAVPKDAEGIDRTAALWNRDAALLDAALLLECHDAGKVRLAATRRFAERVRGPMLIAGAEWAGGIGRPVATLDREPAETGPSLDDLVLPETERAALRRFIALGASAMSPKALFLGPSGTGKSFAAAAVAAELGRRLVTLAAGGLDEREMARRVGRAVGDAGRGRIVLLLDDADAAQAAGIVRSERLDGVPTIVASRADGGWDPAVLRRFDCVARFPRPDSSQRAALWRRELLHHAAGETVDHAKLARLSLTGGDIRTLSRHAAELAAAEGAPVGMSHLLQAARAEYAKVSVPLNENAVRDWT